MEQTNLIQYQKSIQTDKISSIQKKLKIIRGISIVLVIISFILTVFLFLSWNVQTQIQTVQIQLNPKAEICTSLSFNNSNLVDFNLKIQYAQSKNSPYFNENVEQTLNLTTLDLSQNKLQKFSNNSMPFLKTLKIVDNPLKQMSNNKMPMIYNIETYSYTTKTESLSNLQRFQNNYFPIIYYNFFDYMPVYYFNGNYMPETREPFRFINRIKQFKNNSLGIFSLYFQITNQSLEIQNNSIPYLKTLTFISSGIDSNSSIIVKNNYFPILKTLNIYCNPKKIKFENNVATAIKRIYYQTPTIQQWSNNINNELQQLVIFSQNLKYIKNNSLLSLTFLSLVSSKLIDICTDNNFSSNLFQINYQTSLQHLNSHENVITKIDCFQNASSLRYIRFYNVSVNFINFILPNLSELSIHFSSNMNSRQNYFVNNSFSSIDRTYLKNLKLKSFKDANIKFGSGLQMFQMLDSNVTSLIFDQPMPKLYSLNATNCQLTSLDCSTFKNIDFLALSGNQLKDDVIDTLIDCNFGNPGSIYLDDNLISQKSKARAKLSSRYPRTFISL